MYILSNPHLTPTAKLLAAALNLPMTVSVLRGDKIGLRWGNSDGVEEAIDSIDPRETGLNTKALIIVAGSKLGFSSLMRKHEIPAVYLNRGQPERFPVFVRKYLNRGGGLGIEVCRTNEEYAPLAASGYYWSYYHPFSTELGVHILGGKIVKIFKKIWEKDEPEAEFPIRNTQHDYSFSVRPLEKYPKLFSFWDSVREIFPIQFGRADIGWDEVDKKWRIIEFNSAPDLTQNSNTFQMYMSYLKEKVK